MLLKNENRRVVSFVVVGEVSFRLIRSFLRRAETCSHAGGESRGYFDVARRAISSKRIKNEFCITVDYCNLTTCTVVLNK
jgi:hypothetical protein